MLPIASTGPLPYACQRFLELLIEDGTSSHLLIRRLAAIREDLTTLGSKTKEFIAVEGSTFRQRFTTINDWVGTGLSNEDLKPLAEDLTTTFFIMANKAESEENATLLMLTFLLRDSAATGPNIERLNIEVAPRWQTLDDVPEFLREIDFMTPEIWDSRYAAAAHAVIFYQDLVQELFEELCLLPEEELSGYFSHLPSI